LRWERTGPIASCRHYLALCIAGLALGGCGAAPGRLGARQIGATDGGEMDEADMKRAIMTITVLVLVLVLASVLIQGTSCQTQQDPGLPPEVPGGGQPARVSEGFPR